MRYRIVQQWARGEEQSGLELVSDGPAVDHMPLAIVFRSDEDLDRRIDDVITCVVNNWDAGELNELVRDILAR